MRALCFCTRQWRVLNVHETRHMMRRTRGALFYFIHSTLLLRRRELKEGALWDVVTINGMNVDVMFHR